MTVELAQILFDAMHLGVVVHDANGVIISANPTALSILGLPLKKLQSLPLKKLELCCLREDGSHCPLLEQPTMQAMKTGELQRNVMMKVYNRQRNSHRWLSIVAIPVILPSHGVLSHVYTVFEDITEKKETERLQLEEQISSALRCFDDGYWDWNLQKNEMFFSKQWWNMLGYLDSEIGNNPDVWRSMIHVEDQQRIGQRLKEAIEGRTDCFETEVRLRHKHGHFLNVISRVSAERGTDGSVSRISGTNIDITKRLKLEQDLRRYQSKLAEMNESLEQRVTERTQELKLSIREQEAFSYSVSHDLRAPLRHINSYSAILREDYAENLPPDALKYLERICEASSRMGTLIDHLLELSKVSRAKFKVEPVNLSALAEKILSSYRELEPDRTVELSIVEGATVLGDSTLLYQLLENLLSNAWKYTSKRSSACIEFGIQEGTEMTVFYVRDNGSGFDMGYKERLFRAFERLHGSEFDGLGIGLATAQRIIKRHGGKIWAEGRVGEGATFYFTLPVGK